MIKKFNCVHLILYEAQLQDVDGFFPSLSLLHNELYRVGAENAKTGFPRFSHNCMCEYGTLEIAIGTQRDGAGNSTDWGGRRVNKEMQVKSISAKNAHVASHFGSSVNLLVMS